MDTASGFVEQILAFLAPLWTAIGHLDGRTAFVAGFVSALLIWRSFGAITGTALRAVIFAAIAAGGLGSAGFLGGKKAPEATPAAAPTEPERRPLEEMNRMFHDGSLANGSLQQLLPSGERQQLEMLGLPQGVLSTAPPATHPAPAKGR